MKRKKVYTQYKSDENPPVPVRFFLKTLPTEIGNSITILAAIRDKDPVAIGSLFNNVSQTLQCDLYQLVKSNEFTNKKVEALFQKELNSSRINVDKAAINNYKSIVVKLLNNPNISINEIFDCFKKANVPVLRINFEKYDTIDTALIALQKLQHEYLPVRMVTGEEYSNMLSELTLTQLATNLKYLDSLDDSSGKHNVDVSGKHIDYDSEV
ncbi:hypothetical protein [Rickettsia endosymbiont of Culicoides newsteadi]|uniref:hypothetical protein n=1 Tax=Rickettsia endosymbiont of Culicoides newsteadi TaxID=1961830 RepID=UPI000B9C4C27|nr:hypothetical protein [Rickettsia endosymbiont of Culicoides newsteadi]OZG31713.1 hypothetical protein RiCNE_08970 [Rickettsia endosymbiont of Culicoides newsteadi]